MGSDATRIVSSPRPASDHRFAIAYRFLFIVFPLRVSEWQPGDLGVLRGFAEGVAKEARTRGFASRAFTRFAFIAGLMILRRGILSILESTQRCPLWVQ